MRDTMLSDKRTCTVISILCSICLFDALGRTQWLSYLLFDDSHLSIFEFDGFFRVLLLNS
jgi:hypothetical protein